MPNTKRGFGGVGVIIVILLVLKMLFLSNIIQAYDNEISRQILTTIENPHFDILVVTVLEMDNENTTNTKPPRGKLKIEEVLRGGGEVKSEIINVVLRPPLPEVTYSGEWYSKPATEEYKTRPLKGPDEGEKVIVVTLPWSSGRDIFTAPITVSDIMGIRIYRDDPTIDAEIIHIGEFSDENRKIILANMAPPERGSIIQHLIYRLILLLPILNLMLYILSLKSSFSNQMRRRLKTAVSLIPLLAIGLYIFYETGISIYTDIRVDLLLIWPALILTLLFWPALGVHYLLSRRRKK